MEIHFYNEMSPRNLVPDPTPGTGTPYWPRRCVFVKRSNLRSGSVRKLLSDASEGRRNDRLLLQFGEFRPSLLEDRRSRVRVLPKGEEVLVCGSGLVFVALQRLGPGDLEMSKGTDGKV